MISQASPGGSSALTANRATAVPVWRCTRYLWVTTVQLVRLPVFSERARQRWKGRGASLREAVARVASNVFSRDINVDAPLADGRCRYWRMGCPCGRAPGRPSTPPWSRPLRGRAARNHMPIVSPALRLNRWRNANARTQTRSRTPLQTGCARH